MDDKQHAARDELARAVLREHWGVDIQPFGVGVGVNKETWRVGSFWLSADYADARPTVERQQRLLAALADAGEPPFQIPADVPSAGIPRGGLVVRDDRIWRLTRHVDGRSPAVDSEEDLVAVARGLAGVHAWLATVDPALAPVDMDARVYFERGRELAESPDIAFPAEDRAVVADGARFAEELLTEVSGSAQIVHGDPSHPNLRISSGHPAALAGLLDWDSSRRDGPVTDLAVVGQTVLFRSALSPLPGLRLIRDEYHNAGGARVASDVLLAAMVLGKFESIAHHGGRFLRGRAAADLVLSQPAKMRAILELREKTDHAG